MYVYIYIYIYIYVTDIKIENVMVNRPTGETPKKTKAKWYHLVKLL